MDESRARQPTLDFLRGLAILSVVGFHILPEFNPGIRVVSLVFGLGFQGVQLFFLISAITMCYMWDRRSGESNAAAKFYIRRFFRIAPPFWLAICGYLALNGLEPSKWAPEGVCAKQIISSVLFLNGFWPDMINAIVPGGWSIVDEMMFYAFFPLLIVWFKKDQRIYFAAAFLLYLANLAIIQPIYAALLSDFPYQDLRGEFNFFQFFNQAPIFLLGMALYHLTVSRSASKPPVVLIGLTTVLWLGLAFFLKAFYSVSSSPFFWVAVGCMMCFMSLAFRLGLTWSPVNRLGQLSYSIYLVHFAVIEGVEVSFKHLGISQHGVFGFLLGSSLVLAICWGLGIFFERTVELFSSRAGRLLIKALPGPGAGRLAFWPK